MIIYDVEDMRIVFIFLLAHSICSHGTGLKEKEIKNNLLLKGYHTDQFGVRKILTKEDKTNLINLLKSKLASTSKASSLDQEGKAYNFHVFYNKESKKNIIEVYPFYFNGNDSNNTDVIKATESLLKLSQALVPLSNDNIGAISIAPHKTDKPTRRLGWHSDKGSGSKIENISLLTFGVFHKERDDVTRENIKALIIGVIPSSEADKFRDARFESVYTNVFDHLVDTAASVDDAEDVFYTINEETPPVNQRDKTIVHCRNADSSSRKRFTFIGRFYTKALLPYYISINSYNGDLKRGGFNL